MAGKGSSPRPMSVSREKFNMAWERIFGKKQRETKIIKNDAEKASKEGK